MEYRLINFMKDNSYLYDMSSPFFKCKSSKDLKWKELSSELEIGVPELKKRWRTLRDRFKREDKRFVQSGGTQAIKWKYYKILTFLRGYCEDSKDFYLPREEYTASEGETYNQQYTDTKSVPQKVKSTQPEPELLPNSKVIEQMNSLIEKVRSFQSSTMVQAFFNSMAIQVEEANLSFERFAFVQQEVLRIVNEQIKLQRQEDTSSNAVYTNLVEV